MVALTLSLAPAFLFQAAPARAQNADVESLMRQMRGEAPAPARDAVAWQTAYAQVLASLLPDMSSDDLNKRGASQNAWEKIVLPATAPGHEAQRLGVVEAMLPMAADSPQQTRLWMLKMLEWSGRGEAVPTITPLLFDADAQVAERARRALANNSAPQAGASLLRALNKATTPEQKASFINALGFRREVAAIPALKAALASSDELVASQAVRALANMNRPEAAQALLTVKPPAALQAQLQPLVSTELIDAASRVRLADPKTSAAIYETINRSGPSSLKPAALRGMVQVRGLAALPLVLDALKNPAMSARAARLTLLMPGAGAATALAAALPKLPADAQVLVLPALAERAAADRDPSLNTAISSLLANAELPAEVRSRAASALGDLGGAGDVSSLLKLAATDNAAREGARSALGRLGSARGDGSAVEARLIEVANGTDAKAQVEAVRALSDRRSGAAVPVFLKLLDAPSNDVKTQAALALGENGGAAQVPALAAWMVKSGDSATAEKALQTIFSRVDKSKIAPAPFLQVLDTPNLKADARASAFKMLGQLGAPAGFERVRAATTDANADVRDAAIRALADWPGTEALPALMQIARNAPKPVYQVLALRGVARLAPNSGDDAAKVALLRDALGVAKRGEEKQLMLSGLSNIHTAASIDAAQSVLGDEGLRYEAASTILKIVTDMKGADLVAAKPALQKAFDAAQNADLKKNLRTQLDRNG